MIFHIENNDEFDSNIFLIRGEKNILIDTGTGSDSKSVCNKIKSHLQGGTLDMIILTHCHYDHVGGAAEISREFGCVVYSGVIDADSVTKSDGNKILSDYFGFKYESVMVSGMEDGELIDIGEHRLRVVYTPGHTSGGICLFDEITGSLFSGDTVFSNGIGRTDFPTGSTKALNESLVKLSKLNITDLYPGHGSAVKGNGLAAIENGIRMTSMGGYMI